MIKVLEIDLSESDRRGLFSNFTSRRLTEEGYNTHAILNNLRGFRHFFRHAYGATIEYEQLKINLDKALKLKENLETDIHQFLLRLDNKNH
ncbi:MAG: hypothetical protein ACKPGC_14155 [Planktothrix sp.]|uniref:ribonuclease toxin HepT-like protein n=1 Tax=Planktothrix sp. TaxID=3088171 RepID=UPI0038D4DEC0